MVDVLSYRSFYNSMCGCVWSLYCGYSRLELDFRAQSFEIAVNDSHGQLLATAAIGDRAASHASLQVTIDLGLVPTLRVTDISEAEVILFGPEERHGAKSLSAPEYVARSGSSLTLGHHPLFPPFDANAIDVHHLPAKPA